MLFFVVAIPEPSGEGAQVESSGSPSAAVALVDPGFESFALARSPQDGWYSDDATYPNDPRFASVTMTPDSEIHVEGQYSLRIVQSRPRAEGQGLAFLAQAVPLPSGDGARRRFTLSAQMRGRLDGPVTTEVYVWEPGNIARVIARRDVTVDGEWNRMSLRFRVPKKYDQVGIWFYLPRVEHAQVWLDDVRLTARTR
jgi:hypothetical protein